jgi:hypothetical protein
MIDNDMEKELATALKDAGIQHHDYETNYLNGQRDEHWAAWYAAFVLGRIPDLTTPTKLTGLLLEASEKFQDDNWQEMYAGYVLTKLEN